MAAKMKKKKKLKIVDTEVSQPKNGCIQIIDYIPINKDLEKEYNLFENEEIDIEDIVDEEDDCEDQQIQFEKELLENPEIKELSERSFHTQDTQDTQDIEDTPNVFFTLDMLSKDKYIYSF